MDHSAMGHGLHQMAFAGGFDYGLAFAAGFLGSGHCLGMCGALVSGYFMKAGRSGSYLAPLAYQFSRISIYTLLGVAAASLGMVLVSTGVFGKVQSILQMVIGIVVIILALGILGLIPWQGSVKLIPMRFIRKGYTTAHGSRPVMGASIAGVLNGLMPCPLTFAMYIQATSAVTIHQGGALMAAFGVGTLPMMLFVSVAFGKMASHWRGLMLKAAAVVMIVMGCNTFYKGLSFYVEENFHHRSFLHDLKEKIDDVIVFLGQIVDYLNDMVSNLQSM